MRKELIFSPAGQPVAATLCANRTPASLHVLNDMDRGVSGGES